MSTTARSTATSNGCARSSRSSTMTSMPSKLSMAWAIATAKHKRMPGAAQVGPNRRRISSLSWQIIFFNAVALVILIAGVLLVQSSRVGLVDERMAGIKQEALIVAGTLAEYATEEKTRAISDSVAEPLLRQLMQPTNLRARLYGTDGGLIIDTRNLLARNV